MSCALRGQLMDIDQLDSGSGRTLCLRILAGGPSRGSQQEAESYGRLMEQPNALVSDFSTVRPARTASMAGPISSRLPW